MKEDKYYTPHLKDIYFGLECEIATMLQTSGNKPGEIVWNKVIIGDNSPTMDLITGFSISKQVSIFDVLKTHIETKSIRIKRLDKDDIELFGFKFLKKKKHEIEYTMIINHILDNKFTTFLLVHIPMLNTITICYENDNDRKIKVKVWRIRINNKNDLKILLHNLGIKYA